MTSVSSHNHTLAFYANFKLIVSGAAAFVAAVPCMTQDEISALACLGVIAPACLIAVGMFVWHFRR